MRHKTVGQARYWIQGALLLILVVTGCNVQSDEPSPDGVTVAQAREAVIDLHVIFQDAFFRAITRNRVQELSTRSFRGDDGRMEISWSADTNLASGSGRFELQLDGYAVSSESPYADAYAGYIVTGRVVLDTTISDDRFSSVRVSVAHARPDRFPVRTLSSEILPGPPGPFPSLANITVNETAFRADSVYQPLK